MSTNKSTAATIEFSTRLEVINGRPILRLPADASAELPSRGQVAASTRANGVDFTTVVEPDGMRGHWINLSEDQVRQLQTEDAKTMYVALTPTKDWPETSIPDDFGVALDNAPELAEVWAGLTPMARWEWVRWIQATKNAETRARRVEVAISKLESGKRRPCCFDLSSCTDPELAKNGKLLGIS
ncbi:MAG: YdeI/OmpD-associated family protein [Brevibacterium sp.]|uniref:YdeI/OmpD-associated family protein n=1 Tax=Brevibacterium sp. TaxID=1701 RepID=UPI002647C326|nr:YdeI/OmpD-associated family protein [Brevibacterium sp.]MDN5806114.1 YdeI/OmpD-associated family protein [Brevibacterium sp.]MDN5832622.1 YdeI/OmpD-associated family protein [Brevibacterium sp.]MDN5875516.1 YdeI/OmpD-associated family protein [Brevibacterium sp.]MDN5908446.1 YdeI/OmpD-associated family protein [Brevibacterium sp.]MDN6156861.1 YdeI/OmpD-associated family protein [Brevibacterium sp.]